MKMVCVLAIATASIALFGCNDNSLSKALIESNEQPSVYLGAGANVLISERGTAEVYGHDECANSGSEWLFGSASDSSSCTLLTGMKSVDVRLVLPDGSVLNETWEIAEGVGPNGVGIQVSRPNGWILREPTSRN